MGRITILESSTFPLWRPAVLEAQAVIQVGQARVHPREQVRVDVLAYGQ
jgi:hypothetical protein